MNEKQKKMDRLYMDLAIRIANMSCAKRSKVGAVLVKDNNIISFGWNGTPHGFDNNCEDESGNTKPEVIHAEMNAYAKLAKIGNSCEGATLYMNLSPCYDCSRIILQSSTKRVVYLKEYRDKKPIEFLKKAGIKCEKYKGDK
jgi:dCMP deaminase